MKTSPVKKLVLAAACVALCVILPMAFHAFPNGGSIFLPMHIPVLLCGLVCGWSYGFLCGLLGTLLSSLLTGMPHAAILPAMAVECATYGMVSGIMMKFLHTKKSYLDLYISMLVAMLLGRMIAGLAKAWIFAPGTPPFIWVSTSLITGIPGICLQLVLIPLLIYALTCARILPKR